MSTDRYRRAWKLAITIFTFALAFATAIPAVASNRCARPNHRHCVTRGYKARPAHSTRARHTKVQTPSLTVSGNTLTWSAVPGVSSYLFVRKVPGHPDEYSVVKGTSTTPAPVPGATVRFSVRTNVGTSSWAPEVSISYSQATTHVEPPVTSEAASPQATSPQAASPEDVRPEEPANSKEPTTTNKEPVKVEEPATTKEPVKVEEPAKTEEPVPAPEEAPAPKEAPAPGFEMGVVSGSAVMYELPFARKLGAHTARMEFSIDTPASQLAPIVEAYAKAGIKPLLLAGFEGTMPSASEAQNLASWAAAFGPGGSLWKGRELPSGTAVTDIEFGNETSYAYQYSDTSKASNWYSLESYALRAQTYALRFRSAYEAIQAANPQVGLLAQADDGGSGSSEWVRNMFKAVPSLGQIAAGWTIHPYGPKWEAAMNRLISQTSSVGAPSTTPIFVTEWGISTDNGRCLSDNYGFNKCMTYQEAATTLESNMSSMRTRYGARLAGFYLFQGRDQSATGTSTNRESYFGALQSNEATKGAYTATVDSLLASNP